MIDSSKQIRSFWSKPEGKFGAFILAMIASGGVVLLYKFLPLLIKLLENGIYASCLAAALVVITSPIWNSKIRALTSYLFRAFSRTIVGFAIEIDPIGILKSYIEDIKSNLASMDREIGNLRGQIERVMGVITTNDKDRITSLKRASAAKELNRLGDVAVETRQAGRLDKSNQTLKILLKKMNDIHSSLGKLREVSDITVRDMENDVKNTEKERNAILATHKALSAAIKIMNGDPDKRALYDQTIEYLADDYASKVGELESFMEVSKGFIASIELDNLVLDKEGNDALNKFEEFEKKLNTFSLGGNSSTQAVEEQQVQEDNLHQLFNKR